MPRSCGVLGAVPSAAVRGANKYITSFCKDALYRHQKCTANACSGGDFCWRFGGRSAGNQRGGVWVGAESLPGLGACPQRKF